MSSRLFDGLPFEVAHVLQTVERWHDNVCEGRAACADTDIATLADAAQAMAKWKAIQPDLARVTMPLINRTHGLHRNRHNPDDPNRPKLRIVTRDDPTEE